MLSIGEFSRICGVSTKTLRYYDETGLLTPDEINPENGYRYYAISQMKTVLFINRLKGYGFSLDAIGALLTDDPTGERLGTALLRRQAEIHRRMDEDMQLLQRMQDDLTTIERGIPLMAYLDQIDVQLVETKPMNLLSIRKITPTSEYAARTAELFATIAREGLTPLGAPMFFYHDAEFNPAGSDVEFAIPVAERVRGTRDLLAMLCAKSICKGPYDGLNATYAGLKAWMEREGYVLTAAPFDIYIGDPQTQAEADLVTEVYFPVKR